VDNKPTTNLAGDKPAREPVADPPVLAADPGPLPFAPPPTPQAAPQPAPLAQAPGPLPFEQQRRPAPPAVPRRRRHPVVAAVLSVVAIVLFAAAAGGGFLATRALAGQRLLPPTPAPTTHTTVAPPSPTLTFVQTVANAPGSTPATFSVKVPKGWTEFVEPRGTEGTTVRWTRPDGSAELTVERYAGPKAPTSDDYLRMLPKGENTKLGTTSANSTKLYLYNDASTKRSTYFSFVQPRGDSDLWVVSVTVPLDQQESGYSDLFAKIEPSFQVTS
jgi:hypothetical protein